MNIRSYLRSIALTIASPVDFSPYIAEANVTICSYCHRKASLVTGAQIYPHREDLHGKFFWECAPCGAYVGCHGETVRPLGRLANADLRKAKRAAHAAFDPMWTTGQMTRSEAYQWLAVRLGIDPSECHIGMFDVDRCWRVVDAIERD